MSTKLTWHAGRIARVERARSSSLGNPAYVVHFADGRAPVRTQTNGAIGYEIDNPEYRNAEWVRYSVTPAGRMVSIEVFNTSEKGE